jgi:RNA recognition motif-containing protein
MNDFYDVNIVNILSGKEQRTTLMIKNIPSKIKRNDILNLINEFHWQKWDYFYLPMDLKEGNNLGYAFINFIHPFYIIDFYLQFECFNWSMALGIQKCKSSKICNVIFAKIQGR